MDSIPQIPNPIKLTEIAAKKVIEALASEGYDTTTHILRVGVQGGGCSGLQYVLDFTEEVNKDYDIVYKQDDIQIAIDPISASHLMNTTIDYTEGLTGAGFKFLNPNITRSCGCGQSFS